MPSRTLLRCTTGEPLMNEKKHSSKLKRLQDELKQTMIRERQLELQVAFLKGYSRIDPDDWNNWCEEYNMGEPYVSTRTLVTGVQKRQKKSC